MHELVRISQVIFIETFVNIRAFVAGTPGKIIS